jgi:predicted DNA-binding transcriptional regulator YafY
MKEPQVLESVDDSAHDDLPKVRLHNVFPMKPLQLTAHQAHALLCMVQAYRGLDRVAQCRLAGNATSEERMALPSALARLEEALHANGWALALYVALAEGGGL